MNPGRSLLTKVLIWFFMSLALLIGFVVMVFNLDFRFQAKSALITGLGGQGKGMGQVILYQLYDARYYEWGSILERFEKAYNLKLLLCRSDGSILVGQGPAIPQKVSHRLRTLEKEIRLDRPPPPRLNADAGEGLGGQVPPRRGPPPAVREGQQGDARPFRLLPLPPPERLRFKYLLRTTGPTRYWAWVAFPFHERNRRAPETLFLLAASGSITGNGLFFNPVPWLLLAGFVLLASILLWIPLVRSITRPIGRMTGAAWEIARGNFNVHVEDQRKDEIGRLGSAINHMSGQLKTLIMGQKRFLGDIAHELASPVARMELGLSILDQRLEGEENARLKDIAEEVRHMSRLIDELLSFTRAELGSEKMAAEMMMLQPAITSVIEREAEAGTEIINRVTDNISVWAVDGLLRRALSNILRNAIRYAGQAGPIEITAEKEGDQILLAVKDMGPGVPQNALGRLFEPFYRPEAARNRKSGGVGLGLAIVKTCVQACGGTVHAENLRPKGFSIIIRLPASRP